jgi:TATA-box binding protein (TBP) (component of TFIID and TFIIIB)
MLLPSTAILLPSTAMTSDAVTQQNALHATAENIAGTISTMTISIKLKGTDLDLQRVQDSFQTSSEIQDFLREISGYNQPVVMTSKAKFFNSLMFKCVNLTTDDTNKMLQSQSVKLFCNGNLHITGVKNITEALYIGEVFGIILDLVYSDNVFNVEGYSVQLVNVCIKLPIPDNNIINLQNTVTTLKTKTSYFVCYNTERYPGIIVKAPNFSLLIFDSGNLIITATKTVEQIREAHDYITTYLIPALPDLLTQSCSDRSSKTGVKTGSRKRVFDYGQYVELR